MIEYITFFIIAHFLFGAVLATGAVLLPGFRRKVEPLEKELSENLGRPIKLRRIHVFLTLLFTGSLAIPISFKNAMQKRKHMRLPVWSIIDCEGTRHGGTLDYKEAKAVCDVMRVILASTGKQVASIQVNYDEHTITLIESKGE